MVTRDHIRGVTNNYLVASQRLLSNRGRKQKEGKKRTRERRHALNFEEKIKETILRTKKIKGKKRGASSYLFGATY